MTSSGENREKSQAVGDTDGLSFLLLMHFMPLAIHRETKHPIEMLYFRDLPIAHPFML